MLLAKPPDDEKRVNYNAGVNLDEKKFPCTRFESLHSFTRAILQFKLRFIESAAHAGRTIFDSARIYISVPTRRRKEG